MLKQTERREREKSFFVVCEYDNVWRWPRFLRTVRPIHNLTRHSLNDINPFIFYSCIGLCSV